MRYYLWVSQSVYCPKTPHHVLWSSMPKETLELNLKGIPVYSRLCVRQTSGSPITCVKPVANLHHLFMHEYGSCLGRKKKNTRVLDGRLICTFLPPTFKSMLASSQTCHKWTCFVNGKGSRQFHYVACAWNWWHVRKKKQKVWKSLGFFLLLFFCFFKEAFSDHCHIV